MVVTQLAEKEITLKDKLNETQTQVHELEQTRELLFDDVFRLRDIISTLQQMGYA